jgi:hypothetical protein
MNKQMLETEDILYGLQNYNELRPNEKRIRTLEELNKQIKNKTIKEMIRIWKSGHGVLSSSERINALKELNTLGGHK